MVPDSHGSMGTMEEAVIPQAFKVNRSKCSMAYNKNLYTNNNHPNINFFFFLGGGGLAPVPFLFNTFLNLLIFLFL